MPMKWRWTLLFDSEKELKELMQGKISHVHRTMFVEVLLVRNNDEILAFENKCPHQNKSLEGCWLEDGQIVCPYHQYHFNLSDGRGQGMHVDKYQLKFEDGKVFLGKEKWSLF